MPTTFAVRIKHPDGSIHKRLVDAERASQVRDHLLADGTISIDKATTQECVELGKAGVAIEDAKAIAAGGEGGAA